MALNQADPLYGNVVKYVANRMYSVALNGGDECDATIPASVARDMFRIVPGDPVLVRRMTPPRANRIIGFSPCRYYKRYWGEDSGGLCTGWGGSTYLFEVHPDGRVARQIQHFENGELLLYDECCAEDCYGMRSNEPLNAADFSSFLTERGEFMRLWMPSVARNRKPESGEPGVGADSR